MEFPSLKARQFLAVLQRKPLEYAVTAERSSGGGSHRVLDSPNGYPRVGFSWHDRETVNGGVIKRYLTKQVGLTEQDAFDAIKGKLK